MDDVRTAIGCSIDTQAVGEESPCDRRNHLESFRIMETFDDVPPPLERSRFIWLLLSCVEIQFDSNRFDATSIDIF